MFKPNITKGPWEWDIDNILGDFSLLHEVYVENDNPFKRLIIAKSGTSFYAPKDDDADAIEAVPELLKVYHAAVELLHGAGSLDALNRAISNLEEIHCEEGVEL